MREDGYGLKVTICLASSMVPFSNLILQHYTRTLQCPQVRTQDHFFLRYSACQVALYVTDELATIF